MNSGLTRPGVPAKKLGHDWHDPNPFKPHPFRFLRWNNGRVDSPEQTRARLEKEAAQREAIDRRLARDRSKRRRP